MCSPYKNEDRIFKLVERRKIGQMNQFGLLYIYTWKCHNETPCIVILNKQKCLFLQKNKKRKAKQVIVWGLVPLGERKIKERV
jgi:hypothetical protein